MPTVTSTCPACGSPRIYPSRLRGVFERLRREDNWSHSAWNERKIVQRNDSKVHMAVTYTRYRADGSVLGVYESLYILTLKEGRWGIQVRSSFGP